MSKQKSKVLNYLDTNAAYWQYRYDPAQNKINQPHEQANQHADDTWILLLGVLGTIAFLTLLAWKTI